eukprot:CAMPEP_0203971460 /NCGR_PEP_ID=MMETSP0359-20131031/98486_1 /ASSEMBLY_ACC=CAM_ASM_000338 /TAXON_ID=268821 /ORGANISM="Scrippsiella Hangoei, Strain SHTV-5" /LENGTH=744 /DNA_ID=CAMNT_0050909437 /DNA_START=57 /DNA_END=2288 /DNA_ORIENTATION=-
MTGRKVRVNVSALAAGDALVGKFLICVDEGSFVQDLIAKVRKALVRAGVQMQLVRLDNMQRAHLPEEEPVGDVLRDGEDIIAVMSDARKDDSQVDDLNVGCLDDLLAPSKASEHDEGEPWEPVPGPSTRFEEDSQLEAEEEAAEAENDAQGPAYHFPPSTAHLKFPNKGPGDWEVQDISPKLREFIATRFKEVHGQVAEPGSSFVTVEMRPHEPENALPVRYSVARIDIIEFERLCGRKVQETRSRADFFNRCMEALQSLLHNGATPEDQASNMLPYRYRRDDEVDGLLREADGNSFGQVEGCRPIIILDTSGAAGEALQFIRPALKRMLYSFLVAKGKFNFIKFSNQGQPYAFDAEMAAPSQQRLREAEEWLDSLRPVRSAAATGGGPDLLEAIRLAVSARDVDVVYVLTPGLSRRSDAERFQAEVRARNLRNLPIHIIGIDCESKAELDLRRLASASQGSFRLKRFDGPMAFPSAEPRRPAPQQASREKLSIGGQVNILDIMLEEEDGQSRRWLEEQKCANQLLLATATQQPVPDSRQARLSALRMAENIAQRPRLQDLVEGSSAPFAGSGSLAAAAALAGGGSGTAALATVAACASSLAEASLCGGRGGPGPRSHRPRATSQQRCAGEADIRRPSVANPWDRPYLHAATGVVRVSELKKAVDAAKEDKPGPARRPTLAWPAAALAADLAARPEGAGLHPPAATPRAHPGLRRWACRQGAAIDRRLSLWNCTALIQIVIPLG